MLKRWASLRKSKNGKRSSTEAGTRDAKQQQTAPQPVQPAPQQPLPPPPRPQPVRVCPRLSQCRENAGKLQSMIIA